VAYEDQRYTEAIDFWQQADRVYIQEDNPTYRALVQSNIALARSHLGDWEQGENHISQSLALINQPNLNQNSNYWQIYAKIYNTQGQLQWSRGQVEAALKSWKTATQAYDRAGKFSGVIHSTINQATALQSLGFSYQAQTTLKGINSLLNQQNSPHLKSLGLKHLGVAYRRVGLFQESLRTLTESLEIASANTDKRAIWLALGNTQRALGNRSQAVGQTQEAQAYFTSARQSYQNAATLNAQLNHLSLLVETGQWQEVAPLLPRIQTQLNSLSPSRNSIFAHLNFARSVTCLQYDLDTISPWCLDRNFAEKERLVSVQKELNLSSKSEIAQLLAASLQQAQNLADIPAQSYVLGQLGQLYEIAGQLPEAKTLTQQALLVLNQRELPEIRYRWQWQLGRILQQQQRPNEAQKMYATAAQTLQNIRGDLRKINAEARFAFRDNVEPFYRQWVDLLLHPDASGMIPQSNLQKALVAIDALHLAELENFLGCDLGTVSPLHQQLDDQTGAIYPIILENRLAIILDSANRDLLYREVSIPRQTFEAKVRSLRHNLTIASNTPEVLQDAQTLYNWLISPLEGDIESLETLVFVLDGNLRNVPMSVLYDGEKYLIEKNHAIAISPRLELFTPQIQPDTPFFVLTGGVDVPQTINGRNFEAIAQVDEELELVITHSDRHHTLLNENFTKNQIENIIQSQNFTAIHWKTHGVFSSDPQSTFLVAYQDIITPRDLADFLQGSLERDQEPISLLVLSACETAQGDDRAVLGLAGIAVRTGARSTISSLWRAEDSANTALMNRFYAELNQGRTKAEALRQAQLMLIEQGYSDPYTWATYILVGNWL
jgi:CHAT domain-containing protein